MKVQTIIPKIKEVYTSKANLFSNFLSLSLMQAANMFLPLLTVPYIVNILGPEKYGLISFAQAFIAYFTLIVNFGFDYTTTRSISINRDNKDKVSKLFVTTLYAKGLLFLLSTLIFLVAITVVPKFQENVNILVITYLINIGYLFFPIWVFQGMEKMTFSSIFNLVIKVFFTATIFLFLKSADDYIYVVLFASVGHIIAGILACMHAIHYFNLKISLVPFKEVKKIVKEGWPIFLSFLAINIYTNSNFVLLGFITSDVYVGYFSASSKIITVITTMLMTPIGMALFPHISSLFKKSISEGMEFVRKVTILVASLTIVLSTGVFFFSEEIVTFLFGEAYTESIIGLRIISILPFIIGLNNIFGMQTMINLKMDKNFLLITGLGATLCFILNFSLTPFLKDKGTCIAWLTTELFITVSFYISLYRKGYKIL